ncbi:MAG: hypothetical protein KAT70_03965, partial [Thermoplasmata archaeon]|nr:hypothetical protein [Thermoplasmata archaeon]
LVCKLQFRHSLQIGASRRDAQRAEPRHRGEPKTNIIRRPFGYCKAHENAYANRPEEEGNEGPGGREVWHIEGAERTNGTGRTKRGERKGERMRWAGLAHGTGYGEWE